MNVLHIGINSVPNLCIERAFRECGHNVVSVDWKDVARTASALEKALKNPPDLLFMQLHEYGGVDMRKVKALKDVGTFVVDWFGDVRDPLPQAYVDRFDAVNVTACTNYPDVEAMRAMGHDARFLQVGYDELIYRPDGPVEPAPDVVFMGNNYGTRFPLSEARAAMVAAMRERFGSRFGVYGKGWGHGSKHLDPYKEAATYRGAKVAINFDHFDRPGFFSDRYLRAMACGVFAIDGTRMPLDELIELADEWSVSDDRKRWAEYDAQDTHTNNRWHSRVKELEQWVDTARTERSK